MFSLFSFGSPSSNNDGDVDDQQTTAARTQPPHAREDVYLFSYVNTLLLAFFFPLTPHSLSSSPSIINMARAQKTERKRAEEKKIRHGSASLVERARAATITASRERITRKTHDADDDDDDGAKGEWKRQNARVNFLAKKKG